MAINGWIPILLRKFRKNPKRADGVRLLALVLDADVVRNRKAPLL